jgi:predicted O-linked N-acetylglucosamine transferase (SPINDLY family)
MDYRLTDAQADPPGWTEALHTEELVRLPEVWCHYQPPPGPEPTPPPSVRSGQVTFGSFNNLAKVTPEVLALWARLLTALPRSRLALLTDGGAHGHRRLAEAFVGHGVDPGRLTFLGRRPRGEYLQLFQGVDICLDPFPFAGSNTTCDALWMGVPVVTLAGRTCASRQGVTLLSHLGLHDLIADTAQAYLAIATRLAADANRLCALRAGLRARMRRATLTDATRYCHQLEEAYRWMWQRRCAAR